MEIALKKIKIRDLVDEYKDNQEDGVVGYGGRLDIRPAYQREFVYKDKQRNAVIETLTKDFPLNVMYWVDKGNETYEVLDGQQRTISICKYVVGDFGLNYRYFHNLEDDEKEQILNYELMVYLCSGTNSEKLAWFEIVNIAGEKLNPQELRNAVCTGPWLTDAKKFFSKKNCPASVIADKYITGSAIRQDILETALDWFTDGNIVEYMNKHQNDKNANELRFYFSAVIDWVKTVFPKERAVMKSVNWGKLYNEFSKKDLDAVTLEVKIKELIKNEEIQKKAGIYPYLLDGEERHLNLRAFTKNQKIEAYEMQNGICPITKKHYQIEAMEADHILPWSQGGKTTIENCQMLEKMANRRKSDK